MDAFFIKGPQIQAVPIKAQENPFAQPADLDIYFLPLNLTRNERAFYGSVTFLVAVINLMMTSFLILLTFFSSTTENIKLCEKLLIYNAALPDLFVEVIVLGFIAPAYNGNRWIYTKLMTSWLAFILTSSMFHAHLAVAFICYVIALSIKDVYRFEAANNMRYMSSLVIASVSLTICLCSLPATEDEGYKFTSNWMTPSFNLSYQYGSLFMILGMMSVIFPLLVSNAVTLLQARRFFLSHKAKITKRAIQDLDRVVGFNFMAIFTALLLVPVLIGYRHHLVMFIFQIIMHACPVCRVISILFMCPHFQFGMLSQTDDYTDELAMLGNEDVYKMDEGVAVMLDGIEDKNEERSNSRSPM